MRLIGIWPCFVISSHFIESELPPVADIRLPVRPDLPEHQRDGLRPEHETHQRQEDLVRHVGVQAPGRGDLHCAGQAKTDNSQGLEEENQQKHRR